jgi:hypothetical protein
MLKNNKFQKEWHSATKPLLFKPPWRIILSLHSDKTVNFLYVSQYWSKNIKYTLDGPYTISLKPPKGAEIAVFTRTEAINVNMLHEHV